MSKSDPPLFAVPRRRFLRDGAASAALVAAPWPIASESFAAPPDDTVWALNLTNGRATNGQLAFARVATVGPSAFCVEADTRNDAAIWHSRAARVAHGGAGSRGHGADRWETWGGDVGDRGVAKLLSPDANVHMSICALGHSGERLNSKKADLETWRQVFASELRDRGVEAEATPRRARHHPQG